MTYSFPNDSSESVPGCAPGPGRVFNYLIDQLADQVRYRVSTAGRAARIAEEMEADMKQLSNFKVLPWAADKHTLFLPNRIDQQEEYRITENFHTLVKAIEKCSIQSHIASLRIIFALTTGYPMFHDFFCSERNRGLAFFHQQQYYDLIRDRYEHEDGLLKQQIIALANITRLALDSEREINLLAHQLSPPAILLIYNAPPASEILIQLLDDARVHTKDEALISIAYVKTWLEKIFHTDTQTTGYLPGEQCTTLIYRLYSRLTSKIEAAEETTQSLIELYESYAEDKIIKDSAPSLKASFIEHFTDVPSRKVQNNSVNHEHLERARNCHVLACGLSQELWHQRLIRQKLSFPAVLGEIKGDGKLQRCIESIRRHLAFIQHHFHRRGE